jgi:hypothetical protein
LVEDNILVNWPFYAINGFFVEESNHPREMSYLLGTAILHYEGRSYLLMWVTLFDVRIVCLAAMAEQIKIVLASLMAARRSESLNQGYRSLNGNYTEQEPTGHEQLARSNPRNHDHDLWLTHFTMTTQREIVGTPANRSMGEGGASQIVCGSILSC